MMELGRKIHVIALNGGAPTGTREELARQRITRAGTDADTEVKVPLIKTKKLVVWSFATRELITPDTVWRQIELPTGEQVSKKAGEGADEPIEVVARIAVKSSPPVPGADPYREAVTMTLYEVVRVESGTLGEKRFVAAEWVMKDLKLLPAARYKVGDVHRLRMIPFDVKIGTTPGLAQVKQLDDTQVYESPYWIESAIPVQE